MDIEPIMALFRAADAGQLDRLLCPGCGKDAIYVSFTHAAEDHYRVYLTCANCSYRSSAGLRGKPAHFSEERIDPDLQAFDMEALKNMKFPYP